MSPRQSAALRAEEIESMLGEDKLPVGNRSPIYAPEFAAPPPDRVILPSNHHCCGCPVINLNNTKAYCFLSLCLRETIETKLAIKKNTKENNNAQNYD